MRTAITPWQLLLAVGQEYPVPNLEWSFCQPYAFSQKNGLDSAQELLSPPFFYLTFFFQMRQQASGIIFYT